MFSFSNSSFSTQSFSVISYSLDGGQTPPEEIIISKKHTQSSISGSEDLRKYRYYDTIKKIQPIIPYNIILKEDEELIEIVLTLTMSNLL